MQRKNPSYDDIALSHYIEPKTSKVFNKNLVDYFLNKNKEHYQNENLYLMLLDRDIPGKFDLILNDIKEYDRYQNLLMTENMKMIFKTFPKNYASKFREIPTYRSGKNFYYKFEELLEIADKLEQL
jgi:hypothetical protein